SPRHAWTPAHPAAPVLPPPVRGCARQGSPFVLRSASEEDNLFVVDLQPADGVSREDVHEQVYALISTIAEPTTVVVETREDQVDIFDVTLALTPRQSTFPKGHGHLVRLRVRTACPGQVRSANASLPAGGRMQWSMCIERL